MCHDKKKSPARQPRPVRRPASSFVSPASKDTRRSTSHANSAFTLLEVIIVVVILAIAAMTAIPMMSSAAGVQIRSAGNMIAADLEYAKSMAISRGQNYSVVFDTNAESYTIKDQSGTVIPHPVKKGFDYVVDLGNEGLDRVDIVDVDFNSTSQVTFDCLGSPDNGGTISLQVQGAGATINVETITGYIWIGD
jgi:prepilin-type N-terminal cleavage/methylation domain-containing protein